jgi:hypothetical protein
MLFYPGLFDDPLSLTGSSSEIPLGIVNMLKVLLKTGVLVNDPVGA